MEGSHSSQRLARRGEDVPREARCARLGASRRRRNGARSFQRCCQLARDEAQQSARSLYLRSHANQARDDSDPGEASREATLRKARQVQPVALTPDVIAGFRDERLEEGKAANTVRLELAMLSHLYTTAIREWRMGLNNNPVQLVRKPSSQQGRESDRETGSRRTGTLTRFRFARDKWVRAMTFTSRDSRQDASRDGQHFSSSCSSHTSASSPPP